MLSIQVVTRLQLGVEAEGEVGEDEVEVFCLEALGFQVEAAEKRVDLGSEPG